MASREPGDNIRKRKASSDWFAQYGDAPTPPRVAKRATLPKQPSKDDNRREIAGVYAAYDGLFRSCKEGKGQESDYKALLKAAEAGSPAAKRLAARLLPRFVRYFPKHARATGDVLTELSRLSLGDSAAAGETRADALAGLPAVIAASKVETDHQPVIKLVNYAFKQLQSLPAASLPCVSPILPNGTANGQAAPTSPSCSPFPKSSEPLWVLLEAAFTHFPRVVLAACIHALKKPADNPQLFAVASHFVGSRLLAPRRPAGGSEAAQAGGDSGDVAAAGAAAAPAVHSSEAGAGSAEDGNLADAGEGKEGGSGGSSTAQPSGPSLFREVMTGEEREQRWFRQHVQQFLQELPPSSGADACVVLQLLVKELPPVPQPQQQQQEPARDGGAEGPSTATKGKAGGRRVFSSRPPPEQEQQQQQGGQARQHTSPPQHTSPNKRPALWAGSGHEQQPFSKLPPHLQAPALASGGSGAQDALLGSPPGRQGGRGQAGEAMDIDSDLPKGDAADKAGPPPPFPPPGENVCLAAACLWMGGLPAYLDETDVGRECGRHSRVAAAVLPPPVAGQASCVAYVNFPSVRDAMRCYEAMCEAAPWRSCRPLDIRFCSAEAYAPTAPSPPPPKPCTHAWVAGVTNIQGEGEVMRCCKDAGVPAPELLLRVGGRRPGLLMSFATQTAAAAAVQAVRAGAPRLAGLLSLPPGSSADGAAGPTAPAGPGVAQHGESAAAAAAVAAAGFGGLGRGLSQDGPLQLQPPAAGVGSSQDLGPRLPPPEYMSKTLWVGQIPPTMRDEEVLRAFSACGELVGHKFLRHTNCAFVDFATQAGANEARKKMDGFRVGAAVFRVEYKNEKQWWAGQAAARGSGPGGGRETGGPPARVDSGALRDREAHHPPFRDTPRDALPGSSSLRPGPPGWGPAQGQVPPLQPAQHLPNHHGPLPSQQQQHVPGGGEALGRPGSWGGGGPAAPPPGGQGMGMGPPPMGWGPRGLPLPPSHLSAGLGGGREGGSAVHGHPGGPDAQRDLRRLESVMSAGPLPGGALPHVPSFGSGPGGPGGTAPAAAAAAAAPLQQQQQQQQPRPRAAPSPPPWHGKLAKSKVPVCGVVCIDPPAAPAGSAMPGAWAAAEPQHWPPVLDVGMRAGLDYVCGQLFSGVAPGERAVRRVVPLAEPAHQRAFFEFVKYLEGKSRAGVVKLPALPLPVGARTMYLIPHSDAACAALGVPREPAECMLALVVPAAAK